MGRIARIEKMSGKDRKDGILMSKHHQNRVYR